MRSHSFLRLFIKIGLLSLSLLLPASTWGMLPSGHQNEGGWGITTTVALALARTGWDALHQAINRAHALVFGTPQTPQTEINIIAEEEVIPADEIINPIPAQSPLEEARVAAQAKLDEEARLKAEQAEAKKQRLLEAKAKKIEEARQKALAAQKIKEEARAREQKRLNRLFAIFIGTQPVGTTRQVGLANGEAFFGMTFDTFLSEYADFLNEALAEFMAAGENLEPEATRNARREAAGIIRNALKNQFEARKAEAAQALAEAEAIRQTQIQVQIRETASRQYDLQLQRLLLPGDENYLGRGTRAYFNQLFQGQAATAIIPNDQLDIALANFQRIERHLFIDREDGSPERVPNVLAPLLPINRILIARFYAEAEAFVSHVPHNYSQETFLTNIRDFLRALAAHINQSPTQVVVGHNWLFDRQMVAYQAALGLRKATRLQSFGEHFSNTFWTFEVLQDYLKRYFRPSVFQKLEEIITIALDRAKNPSPDLKDDIPLSVNSNPNAEFKHESMNESEDTFLSQSAAPINSFPFAVSALRGITSHLSANDQTALLKWVKGRGQATYSHLHSLEEVVSLRQQFFDNPDLFPFYLTPEGYFNPDHCFKLFKGFNSMIGKACLCPIYLPKTYANNNHACLCAEDPQSCLQADRFALAMMVAGIALEANAACNQFTAEEWAQALDSAKKDEPILNSSEALPFLSDLSDDQWALIHSDGITEADLRASIKIEGEREAHLKNLQSPRAMHALAVAAAQFLNHFPNEWLTYGNLKIVRNYSNNHGPVVQIQILKLDGDEASNVPESFIVMNTIVQEGVIYNSLEDRLAQLVETHPEFDEALRLAKIRLGKRPAPSTPRPRYQSSPAQFHPYDSSSSSSYNQIQDDDDDV